MKIKTISTTYYPYPNDSVELREVVFSDGEMYNVWAHYPGGENFQISRPPDSQKREKMLRACLFNRTLSFKERWMTMEEINELGEENNETPLI